MRRKENFVLQNVGGENLLVPIDTEVMDFNGLITINETALYLWELLEKDQTADELVEAIEEKFGVDRAVAQRDVKIFLDEMEAYGLLIKS